MKRIAVVLNAALVQAVKWGWLSVNPAAASTPPKVRQAKISPPSAEDLGRLLRRVQADDPDYVTFLRAAASTGARRSQICGLRWEDIDLDAARVVFARGVVFDEDGRVAIKGTKTDRVYRVALDGSTVQALTRHRAMCTDRAESAGARLRQSSYVFSMEVDGSAPWRPDLASGRWRRWRRRAGLDDVRLHDIRHFMATTMLGEGIPVSVVSGRLGHARAATTLNVYSHFVEAGDQAAADNLGSLLDGPAMAGRAASATDHGQTMDSDFDE